MSAQLAKAVQRRGSFLVLQAGALGCGARAHVEDGRLGDQRFDFIWIRRCSTHTSHRRPSATRTRVSRTHFPVVCVWFIDRCV